MANIINIQFPEELDNAFTDTAIANEREKTMEYTLQSAEVEAETAIALAEIDKRIKIALKTRQADEIYYQYEAQYNATSENIGN